MEIQLGRRDFVQKKKKSHYYRRNKQRHNIEV